MTVADESPRDAELCLASASPARIRLIEQLGITCIPRAMDIDEQRLQGESVETYVERLALSKARAGFRAIDGRLPTLGADTVIVCREQMLIKPTGPEDAGRMLRSLSGCTHQVVTGAGIVISGAEKSCVVSTSVTFAALADDQIEAYIASGEPVGRAGAYAIQGLGGSLVERLEGSYTNVVGLPLYEVRQLLEWAGLPVLGKPGIHRRQSSNPDHR